MNKLSRRLNLALNLAIILVFVLIGIVFVRNYLLSARSTELNRDYRVAAGTKVSLPGVDWKNNELTLLVVLSTRCPYCTESASFYQQLVRDTAQMRGVQLIAVLPQEGSESKQYLSNLNVQLNEVRQAGLEELGVQGTPTLILVNRNGEVVQSWAGKLPPEGEAEVLKRIAENNDST